MVLLVLLALATAAAAQIAPGGSKTIDGFWQDAARRILFARDAPPSYVYGRWTVLDLKQTYPTAKEIRRSHGGVELIELLYDNEHSINIRSAADDRVEFVRSTTYPACAMHHRCRLDTSGDQLLCALENVCREGGREVLDWKGEERYIRRDYCERVGGRQAQGIPHWCR